MSMLVCLQHDIAWLKDESARLTALAVLRDPIYCFCMGKMGCRTWSHLSEDLHAGSISQEPVHTALKDALQSEGLSMASWEGLMPVAVASNDAEYQGNALRAKALLEKVSSGLLPYD